MIFVTLAVIVGLIALAIYVQRRYRAVQYAFLLRIPLLHALLLMVVALAYRTRAFSTLFVVDAIGMAGVTTLLLFSSMTAIYTGQLLFVGAPARFRLRWEQPPSPGLKDWDRGPRANKVPLGPVARVYIWPVIVASPVIGVLIHASTSPLWQRLLAVFIGLLVAWLIRAVAVAAGARLRNWIFTPQPSVPATQLIKIRHRLATLIYRLNEASVGQAFSRPLLARPTAQTHDDQLGTAASPLDPGAVPWGAVGFFAAALLLYLAGIFVLNPTHSNLIVDHTPALAYVALVSLLAGLVLPAISFYFDFYRVPLLAAVAAMLMLSYATSDLDHYYHFAAVDPAHRLPPPLDAAAAASAWRTIHPCSQEPTMVVVAVSGGGSHAAQWTADVLGLLRHDRELGERFFKSIAMMSLVSGGGLGASYVLDGYENGTLSESAVDRASLAAGRSHVGALAWGIIYPDTIRKAFPILFRHTDRAWALERSWEKGYGNSKTPLTLSAWAGEARQGVRPAVIFNATIMETGERLLISHVRVGGTRARDFTTLYPDQDLPIVTAARLSASFPYLSPMSRPASPYPDDDPRRPAFETSAFHLGDGGYYDNFGVLTAIEYINDLLTNQPDVARRILLLRIQTSRRPESQAPAGSLNWISSLLGPPETVLKVSNSSQTARAELEVQLLRDRWRANGVDIDSETFWLNDTGTLPWHLSEAEKEGIHSKLYTPWISDAIARTREFFSRKADCGTAATGNVAAPPAGSSL